MKWRLSPSQGPVLREAACLARRHSAEGGFRLRGEGHVAAETPGGDEDVGDEVAVLVWGTGSHRGRRALQFPGPPSSHFLGSEGL